SPGQYFSCLSSPSRSNRGFDWVPCCKRKRHSLLVLLFRDGTILSFCGFAEIRGTQSRRIRYLIWREPVSGSRGAVCKYPIDPYLRAEAPRPSCPTHKSNPVCCTNRRSYTNSG